MQTLCLTLETPQQNLALDEALLDRAEELGPQGECLRIWEPDESFVVLGRSSNVELEVDRGECQRHDIPVLRRSSGGATIITGPGCLMYAVVLSYERSPHLRPIDKAHAFVLERIAAALAPLAPGVARRGTSDLALGALKFSGNSLRCKRHNFLYHGTLLYNFSLPLAETLLKLPPRQPDYREGRSHGEFLMNLPLSSAQLRNALISAFAAHETLLDWPREQTEKMAANKYSRVDWSAE